MIMGYAWVSTKEQSLDLQIDALRQAGCQKVYEEVASGARTARPEVDRLLENLREGDVLTIWKLHRLGRSFKHFINVVANSQG